MLKEGSPEEKQAARVYRRFYLAMQLRDLCNEMPIHVVARKYDMPRGSVQSLSQTCQGFAAGMVKFCEQMGWGWVYLFPYHLKLRRLIRMMICAHIVSWPRHSIISRTA